MWYMCSIIYLTGWVTILAWICTKIALIDRISRHVDDVFTTYKKMGMGVPWCIFYNLIRLRTSGKYSKWKQKYSFQWRFWRGCKVSTVYLSVIFCQSYLLLLLLFYEPLALEIFLKREGHMRLTLPKFVKLIRFSGISQLSQEYE